MTTLLDRVKVALRIKGDAYNVELEDLVDSALADLGIAGIDKLSNADPLIRTAVVTYCKLNFGNPDQANRLKSSYDEQKAQLAMCSDYYYEGDD